MASVDARGQIVVSAERFYPNCQNKKKASTSAGFELGASNVKKKVAQ